MGGLPDGRGWLQPDAGPLVARDDLIRRYVRSRPACTLLVAPGGHGKSVTAAQFAAADGCDEGLWLDLQGRDCDLETVLQSMYRTLAATRESASGATSVGTGTSLLMDVGGLLSAYSDKRICVVLDNMGELCDASIPVAIYELIARNSLPGSRLILTARSIRGRNSGHPDWWVVEPGEMLLGEREAKELAMLLVSEDATAECVDSLMRASGGQVALFCVAARHECLAGGSTVDASVPSDLASYLLHLAVSHLDSQDRALLLGASMLKSGEASTLLYLMDREGEYPVLERVAECIPLLRLGEGPRGRTFSVHEYAVEVFTSLSNRPVLEVGSIVDDSKILDFLESSAELERLFTLLLRQSRIDDIADRLERCGLALLEQGHTQLLVRLLESIPVARLVAQPMLLVVKAMALRSMQQFDDALDLANLALRVSDATANGERVSAHASLAVARVYVDQGKHQAVIDCLEAAMDNSVLRSDPSLTCLSLAYLAMAHAYVGSNEVARQLAEEARDMMSNPGVAMHARCMASMCCAGILALLLGEFRTSGEIMASLAADPAVPLSYSTQARGNLAATLCETGRVAQALEVARAASEQCRSMGLTVLAETFRGTEAVALEGLGVSDEAVGVMRACLDANTASGDVYAAELERNYLVAMLRAAGHYDEAVANSEKSHAFLIAQGASPVDCSWAEAELAASLLAVGDSRAAVDYALKSLEKAGAAGARHHTLRARLVVSEVKRLAGDCDAATESIQATAEYIISGDGNWTLAMYIRAFPGLLGPVALAVGVDQLPAHMLRMLMPEHARAALPLARDFLDEDSWRRLATRLLGEDEAAALESTLSLEPLLHVRLFGGLEVATPDGVVSDRAWRKRKARLLFMMLVVRQGRDVPRDMLFEHLWPDMDEERAKNNFYVIWSAMKRALLPGDRSVPCPYVEHVGGICRVVRPLVRSDLDDFDEACATLVQAEAAGDLAGASAAIQRLRDVYRGDLLPSEVYDDWFRQQRERYRVQFGDAMLRASAMYRSAGDLTQAVQSIRAGLEHDPWREDLYQAAMRCQIDCGQRSGAVDMYLACRSRLAEDLGLDPSLETRRLYEEVLAMEEPGSD